ncbi:MAG: glucose-1-phosphate cytidylyltransferase [Vicinamibacterales bacterium]
MKVVLFCGGQGMRMRDYSDAIPKPMVQIGYRPILWHLMKYYAHYGHKEFILCLGYRGDVIKNYFLNYDECVSNDFVLSAGGKHVDLISRDIDDWKITFVDTGLASNVGERLMKVRRYVERDEMFMANYADGLTDLPLPVLLDFFNTHRKTACFVGVKPTASYHVISTGRDGLVTEVKSTALSTGRINGGFFVFRRRIFDYIRQGEELVEQPFARLIENRELAAYSHDGFWACMDTFKEKQSLDELHALGSAPWEVWKRQPIDGEPSTYATGEIRQAEEASVSGSAF